MAEVVLQVKGMSCQNCVRHVTEALRDLPGVTAVEVSLEGATATVQAGDEVSVESLRAAIVEAGYE